VDDPTTLIFTVTLTAVVTTLALALLYHLQVHPCALEDTLILARPTLELVATRTANAPPASETLALHAELMEDAVTNAWATPSLMAQAALVKSKLIAALSTASALPMLQTPGVSAFLADALSLATMTSTLPDRPALHKIRLAVPKLALMSLEVTQSA